MNSDDEIEDDDEGTPGDEWLTGNEAKDILRKSIRWLQMKADAGEVAWRRVGKNRQYLRSSVEALANGETSETEAAQDRPEGFILREMRQHAQSAGLFSKDAFGLLMQSQKFVVDTARDRETADREEMQRLRARITELEQRNEEQRAAAEAALSEATARFVAEVQAVSAAERQKLVLQKALEYVPQLIGNQRVTKLIASMSPDQLELLKVVADDAQFKHLKEIHDQYQQPKPPESKPEQPEPEPAEASVCDAPGSKGE